MRFTRRMLCAGMTLLFAACNSTTDPIAPQPYLGQHPGETVHAWLKDGHVRVVYAARVAGDSLVGHAGDSTVVPVRRPNTPIAIPLADVRYITVTNQNAAGSAASAAFLVTLGLLAVIIFTFKLSGGWSA